jgi:predicted nucleic acid-binding protein
VNYLLDTNVISELRRPRPEPAVVRWMAEADEDRIFLSVVTIAELEKGVCLLPQSDKKQRLDEWITNDLLPRFDGRIVEIASDIAREWGRITAERQHGGRPIATLDAFLAATARRRDFAIVTRNDRDFSDLGLHVVNPWPARDASSPVD